MVKLCENCYSEVFTNIFVTMPVDLTINNFQLVVNQPYDETLEVNDDEEVASTFSPSPRPAGGKPGGYNPGDQR